MWRSIVLGSAIVVTDQTPHERNVKHGEEGAIVHAKRCVDLHDPRVARHVRSVRIRLDPGVVVINDIF